MTKSHAEPPKHMMVNTYSATLLFYQQWARRQAITFVFYQIFSKKFTADHLAGFLKVPMRLHVSLPQHECDVYHYVRLKIGQKGSAMITSKWGGNCAGLQDQAERHLCLCLPRLPWFWPFATCVYCLNKSLSLSVRIVSMNLDLC